MREVIERQEVEKNDVETRLNRQEEEQRKALENLQETVQDLIKTMQRLEVSGVAASGAGVTVDSNSGADIGQAQSCLECPICMEYMSPPKRIWMCPREHLLCEMCRNQLENQNECPTCRSDTVIGRAFFAENIARALFGDN